MMATAYSICTVLIRGENYCPETMEEDALP